MQSGKQRRIAIKAARLRRKIRQHAAIQSCPVPWTLPPEQAAVDCTRLAPYNSYGEPEFVRRGYYQDQPFVCVDCHAPGVWHARRQKWWYEIAQGNVWSHAVRCAACRARRRDMREQGRRTWLVGLQRKQAAVQPHR